MVRLARCLLPLRMQQRPLRSLPSASHTGTVAHNVLHERKCCSYACSLLRYSSNFQRVETTSNHDFYRSTCLYRFITSRCGIYRSVCSSRFISRQASGSVSNSTSDIDVKQYKCIELVVAEQGSVGIIVLNRPEALNALSENLMHEVINALQLFDEHEKVGAIVITGKGKAFAAGADIKEMKDKDIVSIFMTPFPSKWNEVSKIKKPIIAAVNWYALGGGCEVALMCDIVLAGEKALFGQPEINLGTIPGMGGTQRLIREVGKSRAMEMILTGSHFMDANEACQRGLASRVIQGNNEDLLNEAISVAKKIAQQSRPGVIMAKAAVNSAYEMGLQEGIKKEQALFGATFALEDRKEGMSAFVEKRKPLFKHG